MKDAERTRDGDVGVARRIEEADDGEPSSDAAPPTARTVNSLADAVAIYEHDVNVVRYARSLSRGLETEVAEALGAPSVGVTSSVRAQGDVRGYLTGALGNLPLLLEDVCLWVGVMADLTGARDVGVRLARVEGRMCPRFHVDYVMLRIAVTYFGPATEYLSSDRGVLRGSLMSVDEHVVAIGPAHTGDAVLMKGEAWPKNRGRGAVHRSPPASPARPRLVLTLDPL